jgi:hypothetical protein
MTGTIADVMAELEASPYYAGELRFARKQLAAAKGDERKRDRTWRAFVVAMTGKPASVLARTDYRRLDAMRDIFAELDRPDQQELCL